MRVFQFSYIISNLLMSKLSILAIPILSNFEYRAKISFQIRLNMIKYDNIWMILWVKLQVMLLWSWFFNKYDSYFRKEIPPWTVSGHVVPVVVISVLFNITKFISISPWGPELQKMPLYLKFLLSFQAFHPLTTTGLAPLCILVFLNYKVYSYSY